MSSVLHVWHAAPLPFDAESARGHWRDTRARGVHEPRLLQCLQRLRQALAGHAPDMVWSEEPEAAEPCATLALAPAPGSFVLVAEAIRAAAAAEGLCVFNPFDDSVWLPDGRVLERLSLAPISPAPPAPPADADTDAAAQALRGDAPLAAYLLRQWAPLFRGAGFKVRSRPTTEFPWCVFTGKVLRVELLCNVRYGTLTVMALASPGGSAMPPELQTEFGVGQWHVDLSALAKAAGLAMAPEEESTGTHGYFSRLADAGGDPARMAAQWLGLFRALLQWVQPLDDIQALARMSEDPAAPLRRTPQHPIEGLVLNSCVTEVTALLAGRPGAALALYRRVGLVGGGAGNKELRDLLPKLQVPLGRVRNGVRELLVWQGQAGCSDPLAELERLRRAAPGATVAPALQWLLEIARGLYPYSATGPWAEAPPAQARAPWLRLAFATDDEGNVRGGAPLNLACMRLHGDALKLGLTVHSPQDQCTWTQDDSLHTPFGVVSLGPPPAPPLRAGASVGRVQEFLGVQQALAPVLAPCGFRPGLGDVLFVKANAMGIWKVSLQSLGDEGLAFTFMPYQRPARGSPWRWFNTKTAFERASALGGQPVPELPAPVQLAASSPERFARALARQHTLLQMGVLDLLQRLDEPAACDAWIRSIDH